MAPSHGRGHWFDPSTAHHFPKNNIPCAASEGISAPRPSRVSPWTRCCIASRSETPTRRILSVINIPTLLVLGAGASMPYGLPSGRGLRQSLTQGLLQGKFLAIFEQLGFSPP